jgi:riboflavin kinase / FMN adenylyltransferase
MLASALTIGIFDGVHLGHQAMLNVLLEEAQKAALPAVVLTFSPHPKSILGNKPYPLLQTKSEKTEKLKKLGIAEIHWIDFTPEFAEMTAESFVTDILVAQLGIKKAVIGYDHKFGKNRAGNFELLQTLGGVHGFEVIEMPAVLLEEAIVSSSRIRKLLATHQIEEANRLLGEPYPFSGVVVHGEKRGRTIGFPTANLETPPEKMLPADGVYAVEVLHKNLRYKGMMNIGKRPTFEAEKTVEVHILDFEQEIYGDALTVYCKKFIRPVQKFASIQALVQQLELDRGSIRGQ